jgi:hypothetical protein
MIITAVPLARLSPVESSQSYAVTLKVESTWSPLLESTCQTSTVAELPAESVSLNLPKCH